MAIEVTADTTATEYAAVATIDDAAERRGVSAWSGLNDDQKANINVSVTLDLDTLDWIGDRASATQALEWPRTGTAYSDGAWPTRLVNAAIEYALAQAPKLVADATVDVLAADVTTSNIKREKVGPLETEYFAPTGTAVANGDPLARFPVIVANLLRPLIREANLGTWGSGTVVRNS